MYVLYTMQIEIFNFPIYFPKQLYVLFPGKEAEFSIHNMKRNYLNYRNK